MHVAAHHQGDQEQARRAPAIAPRERRRDAGVRGRPAERGETCELDARDHESRDGEQPDAAEAVVRRDDAGEQRADGDAQVPSDREDGHRRRAPLAREPGRELARLGVERRRRRCSTPARTGAPRSNVWANASDPMPMPASAGPATSSQSPRRLSKRCPKNGCTTDDATVAASMIAAVRV